MTNTVERIEENLGALASLLGKENVEDMKKQIANLIVNRVADDIVRRHIVGGANRTLISVKTPLRLSRTGTDRRITAE